MKLLLVLSVVTFAAALSKPNAVPFINLPKPELPQLDEAVQVEDVVHFVDVAEIQNGDILNILNTPVESEDIMTQSEDKVRVVDAPVINVISDLQEVIDFVQIADLPALHPIEAADDQVVETVQVVDFAETAPVVEAVKVVDVAETAPVVEAVKVVDVAEIAPVEEAVKVVDVAEIAPVVEVVKVVDFAETAPVVEAVKVVEFIETAPIVEAVKVVDVAEPVEIAIANEIEDIVHVVNSPSDNLEKVQFVDNNDQESNAEYLPIEQALRQILDKVNVVDPVELQNQWRLLKYKSPYLR